MNECNCGTIDCDNCKGVQYCQSDLPKQELTFCCTGCMEHEEEDKEAQHDANVIEIFKVLSRFSAKDATIDEYWRNALKFAEDLNSSS